MRGGFTTVPSTAILSRFGSTTWPSCASAPFTVTRPADTRSSDLRRDATPARASARWMRIVVSALTYAISQRAWLRAQRDRELVGARELAEVTKRELLEEHRRRAVEQRTTESFRAPDARR